MMRLKFIFILFVALGMIGFDHGLGDEFSLLKGPYLGKTPPGHTSKRFAPDVFYNNKILGGFVELHSTLLFSPDGMEIYFQKHWWNEKTGKFTNKNLVIRCHDGVWGEPEVVDLFNLGYNVLPVFSPKGDRIFFSLQKRGIPEKERRDHDIWTAKKSGQKWSDPVPLGDSVNTNMNESCPSVANNGNLYYYRRCPKEEGFGEIFLSRFLNGKYHKSVRLGDVINSPGYEALPMIAPDESFLIIYRMGKSNIKGQYISFLKKDGSWTEAKPMGDSINSGGLAFSLSLSPDGKYLFYLLRETSPELLNGTRREPGIYWINADIIEKLRQ